MAAPKIFDADLPDMPEFLRRPPESEYPGWFETWKRNHGLSPPRSGGGVPRRRLRYSIEVED